MGSNPSSTKIKPDDSKANLVEHVSGNGCTLSTRGTMERFPGGPSYRVVSKFATSPHEASLLEQQQPPSRINQSGTQTPVSRYKRGEGGGGGMDPYGPMAYFPPAQNVAQQPVHASSSSVNFCAYHPPPPQQAPTGPEGADTLVRRHHNQGSVISLGGVSNTSNTLGRHSRMSRQH